MLPLCEWPSKDRSAWLRIVGAGDFFDPSSRASRWTRVTKRNMVQAVGTWISWLQWKGLLDLEASALALVTRTRVRAYVAELRRQLALRSIYNHVFRLHTMMELACPGRDWTWLRTAHARMRNRLLPRRFESSRTRPSGDLLRLGIRLMSANDHGTRSEPILQSVRYRDGLMIALFAARPLRLTNFAALHVGKSLVRSGDGWHFVFRGDETKSRRPLHLTIPPELAPFLERYLGHHRPLLLDCVNRRGRKRSVRPTGELWISTRGTALAPTSISDAVSRRTKRILGVRMCPYLYRHCAATSVAEEMPESMHVAASLLGHMTLRHVERHYNLAPPASAIRRYHEVILADRASANADRLA
jgi:integrase